MQGPERQSQRWDQKSTNENRKAGASAVGQNNREALPRKKYQMINERNVWIVLAQTD